MTVAVTHTCSRCKEARPASEFAPSIVARKTGGYCRACRKLRYAENIAAERERGRLRGQSPEYRAAKSRHARAYEARVAASPEWSARVARREREAAILRRYGITVEKYQALLAAQGGRCACCGRADQGRKWGGKHDLRLLVDHDHTTGEIRGLVCHRCNVGIGSLGDDVNGVRRALVYLEKPDTTGLTAGLLF